MTISLIASTPIAFSLIASIPIAVILITLISIIFSVSMMSASAFTAL